MILEEGGGGVPQCYSGSMPTLVELEDQVRFVLDERTPGHWQQDEIRSWLNEANRDLGRVTRFFKDTATISVTAGTAEYATDDNIVAIEHVYYDDNVKDYPLIPKHWENMDRIWGADRNRESTRPIYYTTKGRQPSLTIRLFPVPSVAATLELLTAIIPTDMPLTGSDATLVDIPDAWSDALVEYALFKAWLRNDKLEKAQVAHDKWVEKREELLHNQDYLPINREIVVASPGIGYQERWLVEPEGWGWW